MSNGLAGKKALVTGGSRGIGAAIAKRLASAGADVAITYVGNRASAEAVVEATTAAGRRGEAVQADAANVAAARTAVGRATEALGGLDILVHSAGVSDFIDISTAGEDEYLAAHRRHFAVNVEGVAAMTAAALPTMRDGGRVIVIGSVNAHQMPFPGTAIYGGSKAAIAAMARGWARDLGPRRILVNVIQPGPIATDMNPADDRPVVGVMTGMTALKRYGRPEEIAAVAAFLASDDASYVTGATIDVDGGFSI